MFLQNNKNRFEDRQVKLYPNGECVIYRRKIAKMEPVSRYKQLEERDWKFECWIMFLSSPKTFTIVNSLMGLSLLENFDKLIQQSSEQINPPEKASSRYGRKGISRTGARVVRCSAHLMQQAAGRDNLTFATVTMPNMPRKTMRLAQKSWGKIVEAYRREIGRELKRKGLRGEIITVSEIQEKRYANSGLPVLHLHSLWVGRKPGCHWVISPKLHDSIWERAVRRVIGNVGISFKSAANLQKVKSSASGYLGKYMTKGAAIVNKLVAEGFAEWLPKQWWNMTRSLKRWVDNETLEVPEIGGFLMDAAQREDKRIWSFVGHVSIDIGDMQEYWLATYGRLTPDAYKNLRQHTEDIRNLV